MRAMLAAEHGTDALSTRAAGSDAQRGARNDRQREARNDSEREARNDRAAPVGAIGAVTLIVALVLGAAIGFGIDRTLGYGPWALAAATVLTTGGAIAWVAWRVAPPRAEAAA